MCYDDDYGTEAEYIEESAYRLQREREVDGMWESYQDSKHKAVGEVIACPVCSKAIVKTTYHKAFCTNKGKHNCKDVFWNTITPERRARLV